MNLASNPADTAKSCQQISVAVLVTGLGTPKTPVILIWVCSQRVGGGTGILPSDLYLAGKEQLATGKAALLGGAALSARPRGQRQERCALLAHGITNSSDFLPVCPQDSLALQSCSPGVSLLVYSVSMYLTWARTVERILLEQVNLRASGLQARDIAFMGISQGRSVQTL